MVLTLARITDSNWYKFMDILILISRVQHYNELTGNFLFAMAEFQLKLTKEKRIDKVHKITLNENKKEMNTKRRRY
jgi:hypothetical protein